MIRLPRLYPILSLACFASRDELFSAAEELVAVGCTLLQYRNKSAHPCQMLDDAQELKRRIGNSANLVMNDRADLAIAAGFNGVHLGQDDLPPEDARRVIGTELWLGFSTHNPEQVLAADKTSADYIAIGPVFATASKDRPDPVIGLEGVRHARELTRKPLVAIGGITRENCRMVIEAGADSVAVISGLLPDPRKSAGDFFRILG